jgi:hypothetical protein
MSRRLSHFGVGCGAIDNSKFEGAGQKWVVACKQICSG